MNLKKTIVNFFSKLIGLNESNEFWYKRLVLERKASELNLKTLSSTECGISSEKYVNEEIIVSLTTYGKRLYDVYLTIESIMQGSLKPNRIVLWVDESVKEIPITLKRQQERGLEIRTCKDIRSFTKLIPSLKKYPDASIITIDDDVIYPFDFVENLISEHIKYPLDICANRVHQIVLGSDGMPVSYMKWNWMYNVAGVSNLNFLTGVGGVLYPPHSLSDEVFNEDVFMDICKYADDVWFFAMALLKGTSIRKTNGDCLHCLIFNEDVQDIGLCVENTGDAYCRNDIQIKSVFEKYKLKNILHE